jgi:hypothetical protein
MDEYPPAYMLNVNDPAYYNGGNPQAPKGQEGQLIRYLPGGSNTGAASSWAGVCMDVSPLSDAEFKSKADRAALSQKSTIGIKTYFAIDNFPWRWEFEFGSWGHSTNPLPNEGLNDNGCWPSQIVSNDPGFVLLTYDQYYNGQAPPYDYSAKMMRGTNGDP